MASDDAQLSQPGPCSAGREFPEVSHAEHVKGRETGKVANAGRKAGNPQVDQMQRFQAREGANGVRQLFDARPDEELDEVPEASQVWQLQEVGHLHRQLLQRAQSLKAACIKLAFSLESSLAFLALLAFLIHVPMMALPKPQ